MRQPRFQKTADWLRACQNADGGWGELPHSYDDPSTKGIGPSTPSQTGVGARGALRRGRRNSDAVRRGVDYLLAQQQYDGSWKDDALDRDGIPEGVLPALPPVRDRISPLRARAVRAARPAPGPRHEQAEADGIAVRRTDHGVN